jgi:nucleotide-binding universal stress UspA family protein
MFKRILVPLDGSPAAEGILPYVRILGKALGARADLLRTFQNPAHELISTDDSGIAAPHIPQLAGGVCRERF